MFEMKKPWLYMRSNATNKHQFSGFLLEQSRNLVWPSERCQAGSETITRFSKEGKHLNH